MLQQSIVFLFVIHPYDVGDRVWIDNENLVVGEIDLLCTSFWKSGQYLLMPNPTLAAKKARDVDYCCTTLVYCIAPYHVLQIYNIRRSKPMMEEFKFQVPLPVVSSLTDVLGTRCKNQACYRLI
jgi:hypothetical protein